MNGIWNWLFETKEADFAGTTDWRVGLVSEYSDWVYLAIVAVLIGMIVLTVRSYRREGENPPKIKAFLAAVRIAIILIVFAFILRPALKLRYEKTLHSTVIVLVDDSRSMGLKDTYASTPEYRKQLAAFLKVPVDRLSETSRLDLVKAALVRNGGAVAKLAAEHPLVVMRFSTTRPQDSYTNRIDTIEEMTPDGSERTQVPTRFVKSMDQVKGDGYDTNLAAAVRGALDAVQGQRVAGIVLVSDGMMTTEDADIRLQSALGSAEKAGIPIYPVSVGDPTVAKNVAVVALNGPREVRKGSTAEFTAKISHRNLQGQSAEVVLQRRPLKGGDDKWEDVQGEDDRGVISRDCKATVKFESDAPSDAAAGESKNFKTVIFKTAPDLVGDFLYRASIKKREDERNGADNQASALVKVIEEKINVLLIAGDCGWEYQYLRNRLQRDEQTYRLSVWQMNAEKEVSMDASSPDMRLTEMPRTLEQLKGNPAKKMPKYHVVVLYDPDPSRGFDKQFAGVLKEYVRQGGGLCYIVGGKYTDTIFGDTGTRTSNFNDMATLLPVTLAKDVVDIARSIDEDVPQSWPVGVTAYGLDHQITRLGTNAEETANIWSILPSLFWTHPVAKIKPGARVLLENTNPSRKTGSNENEPLVAMQMYEKGSVVYVGFDTTWRWRAINDGYYHRKFWHNVMAFLTNLNNNHVTITTGGERFSVGDKMMVEAEVLDEKYQPAKAPGYELVLREVNPAAKRLVEIPLTLVPVDSEHRPGCFKLEYKLVNKGMFEVVTKNKTDAEPRRILVELPNAEEKRTEANEDVMKFIAGPAAIGKKDSERFMRVYDMDRLGEMIQPERLVSSHEVPRELWDTRLSLVALLVLLAIEWILRKKYNMA